MKIGILTFHCADNYGAVLQTFGLYQKLIELYNTDEVYIVDYRPDSIIKFYSLLKFKTIFSFIASLINLPFSIKRKYLFNKFRRKYFKLMNINSIHCLDLLVCGSDQIWNPSLTRGVDPHYFGIIEGFTGKTVTYGASDGGYMDEIDGEILKKYLANITVISVREPAMIQILNQYNKNISVVLDPVYLFNGEYWQNFVSKRKCKNYILVYRMAKDDRILQDAYKMAKKKGFKVIEIAYRFPFEKILKIRHRIILCASIPDFLSYFFCAEYIFTNSFHGVAFSIIFNKEFCVYKLNTKKHNRIHTVLSEFALTDRYGSNIDSETLKGIDFNIVNNLLLKKREESVSFLKNILYSSEPDINIQR